MGILNVRPRLKVTSTSALVLPALLKPAGGHPLQYDECLLREAAG